MPDITKFFRDISKYSPDQELIIDKDLNVHKATFFGRLWVWLSKTILGSHSDYDNRAVMQAVKEAIETVQKDLKQEKEIPRHVRIQVMNARNQLQKLSTLDRTVQQTFSKAIRDLTPYVTFEELFPGLKAYETLKEEEKAAIMEFIAETPPASYTKEDLVTALNQYLLSKQLTGEAATSDKLLDKVLDKLDEVRILKNVYSTNAGPLTKEQRQFLFPILVDLQKEFSKNKQFYQSPVERQNQLKTIFAHETVRKELVYDILNALGWYRGKEAVVKFVEPQSFEKLFSKFQSLVELTQKEKKLIMKIISQDAYTPVDYTRADLVEALNKYLQDQPENPATPGSKVSDILDKIDEVRILRNSYYPGSEFKLDKKQRNLLFPLLLDLKDEKSQEKRCQSLQEQLNRFGEKNRKAIENILNQIPKQDSSL